jgi:hypothetical protein
VFIATPRSRTRRRASARHGWHARRTVICLMRAVQSQNECGKALNYCGQLFWSLAATGPPDHPRCPGCPLS